MDPFRGFEMDIDASEPEWIGVSPAQHARRQPRPIREC